MSLLKLLLLNAIVIAIGHLAASRMYRQSRRCPSLDTKFYRRRHQILSSRAAQFKRWWRWCSRRAEAVQQLCRRSGGSRRYRACQQISTPDKFGTIFKGRDVGGRTYDNCTDDVKDYLLCSAMDTRWSYRPHRLLKCFVTWKEECTVMATYGQKGDTTSPATTVCSPAALTACMAPCAEIYKDAERRLSEFWVKWGASPPELTGDELQYAYDHYVANDTRFGDYPAELYQAMLDSVKCVNGEGGGTGHNCSNALCDVNPPSTEEESMHWHALRDWQIYLSAKGRKLFRQCLPYRHNNCSLWLVSTLLKHTLRYDVTIDRALDVIKEWILTCEHYRWRPWTDEEVSGVCILDKVKNDKDWVEYISLPCMLIQASNLRPDIWGIYRPHLANWAGAACGTYISRWILKNHGHCTEQQITDADKKYINHVYITTYNDVMNVTDVSPIIPLCPYEFTASIPIDTKW